MSKLDDQMKKLAHLAVKRGVNIQKGQLLVVFAPVSASKLAQEVVKEAYKAGASQVIVDYHDEIISHETFKHADEKAIITVPEWQAEFYNSTAREGAAYLYILSEDPDLMEDVDPNLLVKRAVNTHEAYKDYRQGRDLLKNGWSIIAWPNPAWAKKVYPDLEEEEAMSALAQDILSFSRIDENDELENWDRHAESFDHNSAVLNSLKLKQLHYKNALGTDFTIGLPEGYVFMGGASRLANGISTLPNIPTEEIFSAPHRLKADGKLYASLPLIHNGSRIEDFWMEFKDGEVVDFDARLGKEVLQSILDTDEGARRLGEIALVPKNTPISESGKILYNTLFDENASCHFALGNSYTDTLEGGLEMSPEELLEHGMNQSKTHVDFMVGTPDLSITGLCEDGREVEIFTDGKFSGLFD